MTALMNSTNPPAKFMAYKFIWSLINPLDCRSSRCCVVWIFVKTFYDCLKNT